MKRVKVILSFGFLLFLLTFLTPSISQAEEDVDTQTSIVVLTIPPTCSLTTNSSDSSKTLSQDGTAEAAFDAGYVELDPARPNLEVKANSAWKLFAKSSGFNSIVDGFGNPVYTKATGDLMLKDAGAEHVTNGFNNYKSLTTVDQEIASHTAGVKDEMHPVQYKILLDWTKDIPGTYTATVTYTLATNGNGG